MTTTTREDRRRCSTACRAPPRRASSSHALLMTSTGRCRGRIRSPVGTAASREFTEHTFARLAGVLREGAELVVEHLYVDGDTTIAELRATSTTNEGAAFANLYCWVCRFDGDLIVEARAYLDSMMVAYTVLRNELAAPG